MNSWTFFLIKKKQNNKPYHIGFLEAYMDKEFLSNVCLF